MAARKPTGIPRKVTTRDRYLAVASEQLPGPVETLLIRLIEHQDFLGVTKQSNGWYLAQFSAFEEKGATPLQAMALAYLRSCGWEVV